MKQMFVILLLFLSCNCLATDNSKLELFKKQLRAFIDTNKKMSPVEGVNNVYVVYFYSLDSNRNDLCFTLGYIYRASEKTYKEVGAQYYFKLDDEYILVRFQDRVKQDIENLHLQDINSKTKDAIFQKLVPLYTKQGRIAGYLDETTGLMGCVIDSAIQSCFYINVDEIPSDLSIYKTPYKDYIIREIKR